MPHQGEKADQRESNRQGGTHGNRRGGRRTEYFSESSFEIEEECSSWTCKPNSVRGIASAGRSFLWAAHYCEAQATYPEVVTRRAGTCSRAKIFKTPYRRETSLPIWSCSVWGLPCLPHYCGSGALLPHLFTLTLPLPPGRYIFCGTSRRMDLNPPSRTLSGTLLCGVRTFLPPLTSRERPSGPAANGSLYDSCSANSLGRRFNRMLFFFDKSPQHDYSHI